MRLKAKRNALTMRCAAGVICEGEGKFFGFCNTHYRRWKRNGVLYSSWKTRGELGGDKKERARRYYAEHREERLAYQRRLRAADPEAARARDRAIYRRRRQKHQAANRARERRLGRPDQETVDYDAILRADPCSYCGASMEHVDHIDAVAEGGRNHWANLTAACRHCNRSKSVDSLLSFLLRQLRVQEAFT